jgi:hypothetical protein
VSAIAFGPISQANLEAAAHHSSAEDIDIRRMADELIMLRSALDDWDWAGLARDAARGDFESVADALATVARVDAARRKAP